MVVAALGLGIAEAAPELAPFLSAQGLQAATALGLRVDGPSGPWGLGGPCWAGLLDLHKRAALSGLADPAVSLTHLFALTLTLDQGPSLGIDL